MAVRQTALTCEYMPAKHDNVFLFGNAPYPGRMSKDSYSPRNLDLSVSKFLGKHVRQLLNYNSGKFRISNKDDVAANKIHIDDNGYAGVLYLNENLDNTPGTIFYTHKETKLIKGNNDDLTKVILEKDINDIDKWAINFVSYITFNRLILYPGNLFHGIGPLFGSNTDDARLVQLFFWETLK